MAFGADARNPPIRLFPRALRFSNVESVSPSEQQRLNDARLRGVPWRKWGPYLSERQWGTVREDYSSDGDAWSYFSHDQARSRAYRWGEDGLAGFSDDHGRLCFALALWNEHDPILKERLFGLTNREGNHGEDVKEYYYYLDSTPTHSYLKYLYKYPQAAYPYEKLVTENARRGREDLEFELLDTGVFDDDRYFDVFVEYAKADPEDILIRITVTNRGPEAAVLHLLPTLWFRNTWQLDPDVPRPIMRAASVGSGTSGPSAIAVTHNALGPRWLYADRNVPLLFTENETNDARIFGRPNRTPYVKDSFHERVIHGREDAVNPARTGTKAAAHYRLEVGPGETSVVRLRLTPMAPDGFQTPIGAGFDATLNTRIKEADAFYDSITPAAATEDMRCVMRQALAGMLWSKQHYFFDIGRWLDEHQAHPLVPGAAGSARNRHWFHMVNDDVISMPDKWEYPWYASWDLAFHAVVLALVDVDFAKAQLELVLGERYLHPNGQIPAYEWNFGDVNPPVHAWATLFVYEVEKLRTGRGDAEFLARAFQKLTTNFTWWVNRKDPSGLNVFEGGFLGLDNIGVVDRSAPLPSGASLEQADGTGWMAFFAQKMLEMALELRKFDPSYDALTSKYAEHFLWIAAAMDNTAVGGEGMWDEEDGFFYDLLRLADGRSARLKLRSMVGLLPFCAVTVIEPIEGGIPRVRESITAFVERHRSMLTNVAPIERVGAGNRRLLSVLNEANLRRVLTRLLDEKEFLSEFGIRSLSRVHLDNPYVLHVRGGDRVVGYEPAESRSGMFGGNSNWRGPIWFPVNVLIIRALLQYYMFYGDDFRVECPTGSGELRTLFEVAAEIGYRLTRIFLRDDKGERPVFGGAPKFQSDPQWKDHLLFYEYFHGDNGAGLGASHQTGWTGLVATLIRLFADADHEQLLAQGVRTLMKEHPPDATPPKSQPQPNPQTQPGPPPRPSSPPAPGSKSPPDPQPPPGSGRSTVGVGD